MDAFMGIAFELEGNRAQCQEPRLYCNCTAHTDFVLLKSRRGKLRRLLTRKTPCSSVLTPEPTRLNASDHLAWLMYDEGTVE